MFSSIVVNFSRTVIVMIPVVIFFFLFFLTLKSWLYLGVRTCETDGWRKTKETKYF